MKTMVYNGFNKTNKEFIMTNLNNPYNILTPPVYRESKLLKENNFCVIDVETTGLNPLSDRIVQIACRKIINGVVQKPFVSMVDPEMMIPPVASATHGITNFTLKKDNAPTIDMIIDEINDYVGDCIVVAHNAMFDRAFVNPTVFLENGYTRTRYLETPEDLEWRKQFNSKGRNWLCTYRLAHHMYKAHYQYQDISLSNEALRFWLEPEYVRSRSAHDALHDVNTTIHILMHELSYAEHVLGFKTVEELFELQWCSMATREIMFGKYRGEDIANVPDSYLSWAIANPDSIGVNGLNYEVGLQFEAELEKRRKKQANPVVSDMKSQVSMRSFNLTTITKDVMAEQKPNNQDIVPTAKTTVEAHTLTKSDVPEANPNVKTVTINPKSNKKSAFQLF